MDIRYKYHSLLISFSYNNEKEIRVNNSIIEDNGYKNVFDVLNAILEINQKVVKIDLVNFNSPAYSEKLTAIIETRIFLKK